MLYLFFRLRFKLDDKAVVDVRFCLEKFIKTHQELCDGIDILNSTFTFNLTAVLINTLTIKTFTAYGLLWSMISPPDSTVIEHLKNGSWLMIMLVLEVTIAFVGNAVTKSAQEASVILTRVLNHSISSDAVNVSLQNFVTRLNGRKLHVQNCFIKINWSIFVHVRDISENTGNIHSI